MLQKLEISRAFDEVIKEQTEGYGLREYLEETLMCGQTAFTYYSETTDLYNRYSPDCDEWLEDLVAEQDLKPWDMFPDWDIYPDSSRNKWAVITAMFEGYCSYLLDDLE